VLNRQPEISPGEHYFFIAVRQHPWLTAFEHVRLAARALCSGRSSWHDLDVAGVR